MYRKTTRILVMVGGVRVMMVMQVMHEVAQLDRLMVGQAAVG